VVGCNGGGVCGGEDLWVGWDIVDGGYFGGCHACIVVDVVGGEGCGEGLEFLLLCLGCVGGEYFAQAGCHYCYTLGGLWSVVCVFVQYVVEWGAVTLDI